MIIMTLHSIIEIIKNNTQQHLLIFQDIQIAYVKPYLKPLMDVCCYRPSRNRRIFRKILLRFRQQC